MPEQREPPKLATVQTQNIQFTANWQTAGSAFVRDSSQDGWEFSMRASHILATDSLEVYMRHRNSVPSTNQRSQKYRIERFECQYEKTPHNFYELTRTAWIAPPFDCRATPIHSSNSGKNLPRQSDGPLSRRQRKNAFQIRLSPAYVAKRNVRLRADKQRFYAFRVERQRHI